MSCSCKTKRIRDGRCLIVLMQFAIFVEEKVANIVIKGGNVMVMIVRNAKSSDQFRNNEIR